MAAAVVVKEEVEEKEELKAVGNAIELLAELLPNASLYKGRNGRIMTYGGSDEYTGAAYFSGMSGLLTGAELSMIVSQSESARNAIKSYSPELIVQKSMDESMLKRCTAVSVGSGMGRSELAMIEADELMNECITHDIPLIIDADALYLLAKADLIDKSFHPKSTILTPNAMEFSRLWNRYMIDDESIDLTKDSTMKMEMNIKDGLIYPCSLLNELNQEMNQTSKLALRMGGITIIRKSGIDMISDGSLCAMISHPTIPRRCGGQGDVLAGLCASLIHPCRQSHLISPALIAAVSASFILRHTAFDAWSLHQRSTLTTHILEQLPITFNRLFPYPSDETNSSCAKL